MEIFGVSMPAMLSQLLLGLVNGSFYAILSLGLAVIFGLLNVINFAHGALFMLGALFILVTLLLPKGIIGTFNAWWEPWKAQRIAANAKSAALEDGVSVSKPNPAE